MLEMCPGGSLSVFISPTGPLRKRSGLLYKGFKALSELNILSSHQRFYFEKSPVRSY